MSFLELCFRTDVIYNCPKRSTSPLLCIVFHSEGAFHYNARFVITLISLGCQNEHYNEVAVYIPANLPSFTVTDAWWKCFLNAALLCPPHHTGMRGPATQCHPLEIGRRDKYWVIRQHRQTEDTSRVLITAASASGGPSSLPSSRPLRVAAQKSTAPECSPTASTPHSPAPTNTHRRGYEWQ